MALNTRSLFQTLQLDLTQLDDERLQTRNDMLVKTLFFLTPAIFCVGLAIWLLNDDSAGLGVLGFVVALAAFGLFGWWLVKIDSIRRVFAKSFKEKVIQRMIGKIDSGFTYLPDNQKHTPDVANPLVAQINKSTILPKYNRCWTEDVISGTVRENKFDFMELRMEDGTGKHRKTVFQGILLTVQLKSSFPTNIYIYPHYGSLLSGLLYFFNIQKHAGKAVILNHPEFERLFKVFADDHQASMAVLNSHILERLLKIHQKITEMSGIQHTISFSFVENTITIAVRLRTNLFEPRIIKPINDIAYFESSANYLVLFLGLIDDLNVSR